MLKGHIFLYVVQLPFSWFLICRKSIIHIVGNSLGKWLWDGWLSVLQAFWLPKKKMWMSFNFKMNDFVDLKKFISHYVNSRQCLHHCHMAKHKRKIADSFLSMWNDAKKFTGFRLFGNDFNFNNKRDIQKQLIIFIIILMLPQVLFCINLHWKIFVVLHYQFLMVGMDENLFISPCRTFMFTFGACCLCWSTLICWIILELFMNEKDIKVQLFFFACPYFYVVYDYWLLIMCAKWK